VRATWREAAVALMLVGGVGDIQITEREIKERDKIDFERKKGKARKRKKGEEEEIEKEIEMGEREKR